MNKDSDKTKTQLLTELAELRKKSEEQEGKLNASNQQLDASNQRLRAREKEVSVTYDLLNSSVSGVIITNQKGEVTYCNPAFLQMFEYKNRGDVTGKYAKDLFLTEKVQKFSDVEAIIDQAEGETEEFSIRRKDGTEFPAEVSSSIVTDQKGNNVGRMASFKDITERKRAEEEIKKQLTEKETLLREVHHHIKNNMANVKGLLSLQSRSTTNPEVKKALKDASSRVQSMHILYDKLLLSKDHREISIKYYIEDLIGSLQDFFIDTDKIIIETHISDFSILSKKATSIGFIINELLTNVFKYAFKDRKDGLVSISIEKNEKMVTVTIQDNGVGVDEKILENKSPGFGLTVVKMLVEQLDGTYSIKNDNGTKIVIQFEL